MTNLFSFIWDMTHSNRLDMKIATGGKPNKSTRLFCALWKKIGTLGAHNTMHVTIDWISCQTIQPLIMGCGMVSIDCNAWHCVRQGCQKKFKVQKEILSFIWFVARSILNIQPIAVCHIWNERKQIFDQMYNLLCLSRGYAFWVTIEWIYCTVTFFAHCICFKGNSSNGKKTLCHLRMV